MSPDIFLLNCLLRDIFFFSLQALSQIAKGLMASHAGQGADEAVPQVLARRSVLTKYKSIDFTRQAKQKKLGRHGQNMKGSVQQLDISDNPIGLLGVQAISELLTPTMNPIQTLTELSLNKCEISDSGGMTLARALHSNRTLLELHLSRNQLSDATAAAFGRMLQANGYLEKLDLSWNNIKVELHARS